MIESPGEDEEEEEDEVEEEKEYDEEDMALFIIFFNKFISKGRPMKKRKNMMKKSWLYSSRNSISS
jgi:hypothetical protein